MLPYIQLKPSGPVSAAFLERGLRTFGEAAACISRLAYGRNSNPDEALQVLEEQRGTCSTKHALLMLRAVEQGVAGMTLHTGIYRMHARNTPRVGDTLRQYGLAYLPEAHCYLKYQGHILDCTRPGAGAHDFVDELMEERQLQPQQLAANKTRYHKSFLNSWLAQHPEVPYDPDALWAIREQCIRALSGGA